MNDFLLGKGRLERVVPAKVDHVITLSHSLPLPFLGDISARTRADGETRMSRV